MTFQYTTFSELIPEVMGSSQITHGVDEWDSCSLKELSTDRLLHKPDGSSVLSFGTLLDDQGTHDHNLSMFYITIPTNLTQAEYIADYKDVAFPKNGTVNGLTELVEKVHVIEVERVSETIKLLVIVVSRNATSGYTTTYSIDQLGALNNAKPPTVINSSQVTQYHGEIIHSVTEGSNELGIFFTVGGTVPPGPNENEDKSLKDKIVDTTKKIVSN